jgi:hypothetical protein
MTRQILAILIVVAILAVVVRVAMQSGASLDRLTAVLIQPTVATTPELDVRVADAVALPTQLPQALASAVVATVQAATPHPKPAAWSTQRPVVLPNTGVFGDVDWTQNITFIAFITIISTVAAVGYWLGRNK